MGNRSSRSIVNNNVDLDEDENLDITHSQVESKTVSGEYKEENQQRIEQRQIENNNSSEEESESHQYNDHQSQPTEIAQPDISQLKLSQVDESERSSIDRDDNEQNKKSPTTSPSSQGLSFSGGTDEDINEDESINSDNKDQQSNLSIRNERLVLSSILSKKTKKRKKNKSSTTMVSSTSLSQNKNKKKKLLKTEETILTMICCDINSLSNKLLYNILEFTGETSYASFGLINKKCNYIFQKYQIPKETFRYGYDSLKNITKKVSSLSLDQNDNNNNDKATYFNLAMAVVCFNRKDILHWTFQHQKYSKKIVLCICQTAAIENRVNFLQDLLQDKLLNPENQHILQYIQEQQQPTTLVRQNHHQQNSNTNNLCNWAAEGGHTKMLDYLLQHKSDFGTVINKSTARVAAISGKLNVLKYLHDEKKCEFGSNICDVTVAAAVAIKERNQQSQFKQDPDIDIDIDIDNMEEDEDLENSRTDTNNHFEILKWLHLEKGFSVDEDTFMTAKENELEDIVNWLKEVGCPEEYHDENSRSDDDDEDDDMKGEEPDDGDDVIEDQEEDEDEGDDESFDY